LSRVFKGTRHADTRTSRTLQLGLQIILAACFVIGFSIQGSAQTTNNPQTPLQNGASTYPAPPFPEAPSNSATSSATAAVPSADQSHYFISPGDVLDVSVFGAPDLSQKTAVNSSGNIYMPLINNVHVAGMHAEDAQSVVEQAYFKNGVLKFPHVSIVITSYSSGVVLLGEVGKPGIYPIVGSGTLFDIFAEAGGTTANAGQIVTITHKDSTNPQTVFLTNDPVQSQEANVPVRQGDTIIVSKAGVIYVVGEVLSPSGFLMDEKGKYTVMKAVAMAHGLAKFAKPSKARIVRRTPGGQEEIPVPLDQILVSKAADIQMQSNDILFIPSSKGKQAAARTVDVAVALASGLAFYGFYR
jgi:polysaccharide biosynthesis/export protein